MKLFTSMSSRRILSVAILCSLLSYVESTTRGTQMEQDVQSQRRMKMKSSSTSSSTSDDEEVVSPILACNILELFDTDGRGIGNDPNIPGFEWYDYCDTYAEYNDMLCPTDDVVANICAHKNPHLNPAVRVNFCIPFFESIEYDDLREDCTKYCTNYVSMDRGGCCGFVCN